MAKLRVGVIEAGSWTVSLYLPTLVSRRDLGDRELTAVSRRNPELRPLTDEILNAAYRSADRGSLEDVTTLDRVPA